MAQATQKQAPKRAPVGWSVPLANAILALDEYKPTIPEAVSQYYAQKAGVSADDPRVIKVLSLAADKFLCDVINEARQTSMLRQRGAASASGSGSNSNSSSRGSGAVTGKRKAGVGGPSTTVVAKNEVFEMEDLERSLEKRSVYLRRRIGVTAELKYTSK